ncbi:MULTISPECIES: protein kinase domain-containing protein [Aerosakkonema]|uniref:protein kinase domain-containing protein n=1 Tax=Aerosakkonema TaxID=1246629 RepID=UPI0035BA49C4
MNCCLNPSCQQPLNPKGTKFCQSCGAKIEPLLRNRYRVVRPIGQGGFGKTYLAVDEDRLQTSCVIKQFSPQAQGTKSLEKAIALFNQEAVRLHQLGEHPQIPTLLAYFEHEKRLYLVQQFIEGKNLFQELQGQGAFGEDKIREILLDILPILKFIHSRQVIHRDITPTNIIRRNIDGKLVLIDFGIAKQMTETETPQPGTRIGTEGYAPLEQLRNGQVYPASDIYSLAATCIFLMTQTKPDNLYNPLDGRWIWREHLLKKGRVVSDRLSQVLDKMLQDLVSQRYQSADEVLKDLNSATSQASVSPGISKQPAKVTPPPTSKQPTSRPIAPNYTTSRPPLSQPPISKRFTAATPASGLSVSKSSSKYWRCVKTLVGHSSWVMCVAIGPFKQLVASGSLDDTIKIWNLQTGELRQTLTGHSKGVNALAIDPDGKTLVSCSDDDRVKIWDIQTGKQLHTLTEHNRDVTSIAISPDGQTLISGSEDRTVKVWKLQTGAPVRTLLGPAGMIQSLAIAPNTPIVATGGLDNQIKLWNYATGEFLRTLNGHLNSVHSVAFTPDAKTLVSASKDKTIKLWNVAKGQIIRTLADHSGAVNSVIVTPDGQYIISGSSDKTIKIWNLATGEMLDTIEEHTNPVNSLAISFDGLIMASGSWDNTIKIWQRVG